MNNDLLEQLRPIHMPEHAIGIWPLAPGWWLLLALPVLVLLVLVLLQPLLKARRQKQQIQQNTKALLNALYMACKKETDFPLALQIYLQKSNDIFKRVIHSDPRLSGFAHLSGSSWVSFIAKVDPTTTFATLYGDSLYARRCQEKINLDDLHQWALQWVQQAQTKVQDITP